MAAARARLVTALVALGFVAAVWLGGDGGGARAALGQATGPLVTIAPGDAAVLVAQGLVPGVTRTGEVTVTNVGDSAGAFALSAGDLVDSVAPLSHVLALAVDEVTPGGAAAPVFSGRLDALSGVALGTLGQGEARRYRFAVSFPSGRPDAVDNAYQGASTAVTFVWSTSSAAAPPTAAPPQGANATDTRTPAISVSGITVGPGRARSATLTARARQKAAGVVVTWVGCSASCRISLGGTAHGGTRKVRLRAVGRGLRAAGRVRVAIALPPASRAALAGGRPITVRLRLTAKLGGRVVVVRRTVRVIPAGH
jgi:hypothetical protein